MKNNLRTAPNFQQKNLVTSSLQSNRGVSTSSASLIILIINYLKRSGALKGIDEKFETNSSNLTTVFNITLSLAENRNSFNHNSNIGNSPIRLGWSLDLITVTNIT